MVTAYGAVGNGHTDSTAAIAKATSIAEARGGTLYFPPGHYMVHGSGLGSAIAIREGRPLTIAGPGSGLVTVTNTNVTGGLLSIRVDHTVVEGLTLDAQSYNTRQALGAIANEVTVENCRILGGRQFFAIYYAGPAGATPSAPAYNTGNRLLNDVVSDLVANDGISWSFQESSLIENLAHTGSRLALYVDRYVTVQNETYHPGPQGGGTAGFWISAPSDHITINNFTSYGMGGIISDNGTNVSSNISIANERLMVPGNTLRVDAVNGLTIRGCNFGSDGTLMFTGSMAATAVVVEDCAALPMIRFQGGAIVRAAFIADTYTAVAAGTAQHRQTFYNFNSAAPSFTVSRGVWANRIGGFFGGAPATYTVSNLVGY
jgi:Pectate lyase superfamily protein